MYKLKVSARKLLTHNVEVVWENLRGTFTLVFDDGEIETNHKETAYSRLFWEFIRQYPRTPLLMKHHFKIVNGDDVLTAKTHLKMFDSVVWDVYDTYKEEGITIDNLMEQTYLLNNRLIYNFLSCVLARHMTSLDIVDFVEILNDPEVAESQKNLPDEPVDRSRSRNQQTIDNVTDVLKKVFKENRYPDNSLSKLTRAKLIRVDQVYQGLGVRGYLTDTGSDIFAYPIMTGFVRGMNKFHDVLIESRSASKSLFFSKTPLQDAEYFSRRLQIQSQTLKNLHVGDCGSQHYLHIRVRDVLLNTDGVVERKGDLDVFDGKYYMDDESGLLKMLRKTDKHLLGKKLKIRSSLAGCMHPDPYGICSTCFGALAENVPPRTNIGQLCATTMTGKSSQLVLSVKHFDGSSVIEPIRIDPTFQKYILPSEDNNSYKLNEEYLSDKSAKIVIKQKDAKGLPDVMGMDDVTLLTISRVSELFDFGIKYVVWQNGIEFPASEVVPVCMGKRQSSISHELLAYVKKYGWVTDDSQNYVIDLAEWDYSDPIMILPFRHFNMSDHSDTISSIIESNVTDKQRNNSTPEAVLLHLADVVNSKLSVNIAVLEVILHASMVVSTEDNNYRIPKPWTKRELGVLDVTIPNRSLGAAMAYEAQRDILTNPSSFFNRNRPSHPMDVLLMPKEVVDHVNRP